MAYMAHTGRTLQLGAGSQQLTLMLVAVMWVMLSKGCSLGQPCNFSAESAEGNALIRTLMHSILGQWQGTDCCLPTAQEGSAVVSILTHLTLEKGQGASCSLELRGRQGPSTGDYRQRQTEGLEEEGENKGVA